MADMKFLDTLEEVLLERGFPLDIVQKVLETAQTVDAVEVVRCEKCKHAVWDEEIKMWRCVESAEYDEEMGGYFGVCEYHYGDFFCSYGKRKDGDGNAQK